MAKKKCVGCDIVLEAQFLGLKGEEVAGAQRVVVEKDATIPCTRKGTLLKEVKVATNGKIHFLLYASGSPKRTVTEVREGLEWTRPADYAAALYNNVQAAFRHIPLVGKTIEEVAPDAWHERDLKYRMRVDAKHVLTYEIIIDEEQQIYKEQFCLRPPEAKKK